MRVGVWLGVDVLVGVHVIVGEGVRVGVCVIVGVSVMVGVRVANAASTKPAALSLLRIPTLHRSPPPSSIATNNANPKLRPGLCGPLSDAELNRLRSPGDSLRRPVQSAAGCVPAIQIEQHALAAAIDLHGPDSPLAAAIAHEGDKLTIR